MTNPTSVTSAPQNLIPNNAELKDLLDLFRKDVLLNLNCHHIGTIQEFNSENQTATVTLNYKKTFLKPDASGVYVPVLVDYPILLDCPVIVLGGARAALTFPIGPGDECVLLYNDRDLDNWFAGNTGTGTATPRLHGFPDAMALVGIRSKAKVLAGYDSVNAALRNGTTAVLVGETLVTVKNSLYTLNGLLQELVTNVKSLVTQTAAITVTGVSTGAGVSGPVANQTAINAVTTQLTTTANKIAGLLG